MPSRANEAASRYSYLSLVHHAGSSPCSEVADAVRQKSNEVYLSVVSVWEALVKHQLGKLPMPSPADEYLRTRRIQHQILSLDLNEAAIDRLLSLPRHHNDPFDRMLICQAIHHDMTLATADDDIAKYPVKILSS